MQFIVAAYIPIIKNEFYQNVVIIWLCYDIKTWSIFTRTTGNDKQMLCYVSILDSL